MNEKMQKRRNPPGQHLGAKRLRQQELGGFSLDKSGGDKRQQRFWPCPICNRSFALFRLEEHVNQCLDTSPCPSTSLSPPTTKGHVSCEPPAVELNPRSLGGSVDGRGESRAVQTSPSPSRSVSSGKTSSLPTERGFSLEGNLVQEPPNENVEDGGRGWAFPEEVEDGMKAQLRCKLEYSDSNVDRDCESTGLSAENPGTGMDSGGLDENGMSEDGRDANSLAMNRPPPGFKLFQRQVQSQARLSMFLNFSSAALRKPSVTVLQAGMVLFRSWLDLNTQQKFVQESQGVSHLFHRPTTSGGGKYHIYSMCWGPKWDARAHRYICTGPEHPIPPWMFALSQKLAQDAQQHTSMYPVDSTYAPDVGLVNFYPVKADELGVIGLGGHQDLDDSGLMPVVSVSIGDSMTFFYRRFPPFSRRKSGVSISVDEEAVRSCEDGDVAHNREHQILLESGDVLVFGGKSRLVYHGTRHVQPGTRPPGLHMVPGRLNFTFRQTIAKAI